MAEYYAALGVNSSAELADIKRAYRMLALKHHPDKSKDEASIKTFHKISEAFDILSDSKKRAVYDQWGKEGLKKGIPVSQGGFEGPYTYSEKTGLENFKKFFGTSNPFSNFGFADTLPFEAAFKDEGPKKAPTVERELVCSLEEIYCGCTKRLSITRKRYNKDKELVDDTKQLSIIIKPGWKKGTKFTFAGEGDEGPGILAPDIVFTLVEAPHTSFERDGNTLIFTAKIPLVEALTDCAVKVPTLDGRTLAISCNEVVFPGYEKLVPGEGMPLAKTPSQRGDLRIRFQIEFPKYLSDSKRAQVRRLLINPEKEL